MNQGFFGFSNNTLDNTKILVKEFDVSGTFVIPPFAKRLYVLAIGGGGGGGAGGRFASGSTNRGGGGGTPGSMICDDFPIDFIAPPGTILNVTIAAGGGGGAGQTTNSTKGDNGSPGGTTTIIISGSLGTFMNVPGGAGGTGGGLTSGTDGVGGAASTNFWFGNSLTSGKGGDGSPTAPEGPGTTNNPATTPGLWNYFSNGGAGGGGLNLLDVASSGGGISAGSAYTSYYSPRYVGGNIILQGGQPNTPAGGDSSVGRTIGGMYSPGLGGVGGGGGSSTAGGNGQNGYRGGGGGGGGSSINGFTGGAGGAGGNGYVVLIAYG